ncbi:hypothetical protein EYS14_16420 [Alteromonadaceae bacterium M269]|jgi:DNA-binding Xre family transcriptional regulator|nr:hypothetical protein EYS14_16420 [Alteromonadaceae bacterium M269]
MFQNYYRSLYEQVKKAIEQAHRVDDAREANFSTIEKETGIKANTILKFLNTYSCQRRSHTLDVLCDFYHIKKSEIVKYKRGIPQSLINTIYEIWDGSEQHANVMKSILKVSHKLKG